MSVSAFDLFDSERDDIQEVIRLSDDDYESLTWSGQKAVVRDETTLWLTLMDE